MELSERYGYADDIESIVDTKDSADGLGVEMTTSVVLERLNQLEAAIAKYEKYIDIKEDVKPQSYSQADIDRAVAIMKGLEVAPYDEEPGKETKMDRVIKREKWGLLCKPRNKEGRWRWVLAASYIFDTRVEAYEKANEWNIKSQGYVYKPVLVSVEAVYEE